MLKMDRITVGGKALPKSLDDGDGAAYAGLETDIHTALFGGLENLVAVCGQQGLVCRHHVFALPDGLQNEAFCGFVASDEFNDNGYLRVPQDGPGVLRQEFPVHLHRPLRFQIEIGDLLDDDPCSQTLLDETAVFHEQLHRAGPDVAESDQPGIDGLHRLCSRDEKG